MPVVPLPPSPPDIPDPPARAERPGVAFYLAAAMGTFMFVFLSTTLVIGAGCAVPDCGIGGTAILLALIAEPFLVIIVMSVLASDTTGRVALPVRSILAGIVPAAWVAGGLIGESLNGRSSEAVLSVFLVVFGATLFTWPFAFVLATFTSWTNEARRSIHRRRLPAPHRADL